MKKFGLPPRDGELLARHRAVAQPGQRALDVPQQPSRMTGSLATSKLRRIRPGSPFTRTTYPSLAPDGLQERTSLSQPQYGSRTQRRQLECRREHCANPTWNTAARTV